jgi:hypothetical protein
LPIADMSSSLKAGFDSKNKNKKSNNMSEIDG